METGKMTLKQKIGQLFAVGFPGGHVTDEFRALVRDYKVGNVILFAHNITSAEQVKELTDELRELIVKETGIAPLILVDEEGGVVSRLPQTEAVLPSALAQSRVGDRELIFEGSQMIGETLRSLGINLNLAPVADINNNPENLHSGARSFGVDAATVSEYAAAAAKGFSSAGILCCAKHFPGSGDAESDPHISLPVLRKSVQELENLEMIPFQELVRAGIPAVMVSHLAVPSLNENAASPEAGEVILPCTMSRQVVTGYLREKLKFDGLIVSDCMQMEAVHTYFGTENGCVAALNAGIDLVLISHSPEMAGRSIDAVMRAMTECADDVQTPAGQSLTAEEAAKGKLSEQSIDLALSYVLSAKEKVFSAEPVSRWADREKCAGFAEYFLRKTIRPYQKERTAHIENAGCLSAAAKEAGNAECLSTTAKEAGNAKFTLGTAPFFVSPLPRRVSLAADQLKSDWDFAHLFAGYFGGRAAVFSENAGEDEIGKIVSSVGEATSITIGTLNGHMHPGQLRLLQGLEALGLPVAHVALVNPYDLDYSEKAVFKIALYEYSRRTIKILKDYFLK